MNRTLLDGLLCTAAPRLARWTVVVVDRFDGEEHPMPFVRLRWRRSADEWVRYYTEQWKLRGSPAQFEVRPLGPPGVTSRR